MYVNGNYKELTACSNHLHQHNKLLSFLGICELILTLFKFLGSTDLLFLFISTILHQ
jgi:hypothetical protein